MKKQKFLGVIFKIFLAFGVLQIFFWMKSVPPTKKG